MAKRTTKKMVDAISLLTSNKEMSPRQAMLKAGYSENAAKNPKRYLLSKPQILSILDQMKQTLQNRGIDGFMLGNRLADLATSDNTKEFLAAYDRIAKVVGIEQKKEDEGIKRQVTFTEWVQEKTPETPTPLNDVSVIEQEVMDTQPIEVDKSPNTLNDELIF